MGNGGGPNTLSGTRTRYVWRGRDWTVDTERVRWKTAWLTWAVVFMSLFAGLFLLAGVSYALPGEVKWFLVTAGFLLCGALVAIYLILHIKTNPALGVVYKRFYLWPSTLDAMLKQACEGLGVELVPTGPVRMRWDYTRDWEVYRSYVLKGMGSKVNVVRKFRLRINKVMVVSFLEMGPKGHGEDETLDILARRIDAANVRGEEDISVEFGKVGTRFKAWNMVWVVSMILSIIWIVLFWGIHLGVIQDQTLVVLVEEYHLTLILIMIAFLMSISSRKKIVALSRQVDPS